MRIHILNKNNKTDEGDDLKEEGCLIPFAKTCTNYTATLHKEDWSVVNATQHVTNKVTNGTDLKSCSKMSENMLMIQPKVR